LLTSNTSLPFVTSLNELPSLGEQLDALAVRIQEHRREAEDLAQISNLLQEELLNRVEVIRKEHQSQFREKQITRVELVAMVALVEKALLNDPATSPITIEDSIRE
jgi:hypothetical protein